MTRANRNTVKAREENGLIVPGKDRERFDDRVGY